MGFNFFNFFANLMEFSKFPTSSVWVYKIDTYICPCPSCHQHNIHPWNFTKKKTLSTLISGIRSDPSPQRKACVVVAKHSFGTTYYWFHRELTVFSPTRKISLMAGSSTSKMLDGISTKKIFYLLLFVNAFTLHSMESCGCLLSVVVADEWV